MPTPIGVSRTTITCAIGTSGMGRWAVPVERGTVSHYSTVTLHCALTPNCNVCTSYSKYAVNAQWSVRSESA